MNVQNDPSAEEGEFQSIQVVAYDGAVVEVKTTESDGHHASITLTPGEARELATRLIQGAEMADPSRNDWRQRW